MNKYLYSLLLLLISGSIIAQDYEIAFDSDNELHTIDSVYIYNASQNTNLTIYENDFLSLLGVLTNSSKYGFETNISIYPNPTDDNSTLEIYQFGQSNTNISIFDLSGKQIIGLSQNLDIGKHSYQIRGLSAGIYYVRVLSEKFEGTVKLVSIGNNNGSPELSHIGEDALELKTENKTKSTESIFEMQYNNGELLVITAYSGLLSARTTLIPTNSQTVMFNFVECEDYHGLNYTTITIGEQVWMAENLKLLPEVFEESSGSVSEPKFYVYDYSGSNVDEARLSQNYSDYGVLYNCPAAQISCPFGWKLPSHDDWTTLEREICLTNDCENDFPFDNDSFGAFGESEGSALAGFAEYWHDGELDENNNFWSSGFGTVPGGMRSNSGVFERIQNNAYFYSSTSNTASNNWIRAIQYDNTQVYRTYDFENSNGFSVRCILNQDPSLAYSNVITLSVENITLNQALITSEVTFEGNSSVSARGIVWGTETNLTLESNSGFTIDGGGIGVYQSNIDGLESGTTYNACSYSTNDMGTSYGEVLTFTTLSISTCGNVNYELYAYPTIQIGNQCWFAENLKYLPDVVTSSTTDDSEPYYYVYGYEGTNVEIAKVSENYNTYGVLYNWTAALDACPTGWHLPSDDDWKTLEIGLGMNNGQADLDGFRGTNEGSKIAGEEGFWIPSNLVYSDEFGSSGFSALPGGQIGYSAYGIEEKTWFWTSTPWNSGSAIYRGLWNNYQSIERDYLGKQYAFSVRCVRDENSEAYLPYILTTDITQVTSTSAVTGGIVVNDGGSVVIERGIVYSEYSSPAIDNNQGIQYYGNGVGEFFSQLYGLEPATTYYVRAFAINETGAAYGDELSFITGDLTLPDIQTIEVNNIGEYSADVFGIVNHNGGSQVFERGFVCSTSSLPTVDVYNRLIIVGNGTGNFSASIQGIFPGTTYFVRAYASNSLGISYGEVLSFETNIQTTPTVITNDVSNETCDYITISGEVTNDLGSSVLERGFVWGEELYPSTENNLGISIDGSGIGEYSHSIPDLVSGNTYYIRSYASNSNGVAYGNQIEFTKEILSISSLMTGTTSVITDTSITVGGIISNNGCSEIIDRGVVWSSSLDPDLDNNEGVISLGAGSDVFVCEITGLDFETQYFIRAFAENGEGIAYGQMITALTLEQNPNGLPCEGMDSVFYENYWYKTVYYGGICWFAENLRYLPSVSLTSNVSYLDPVYYVVGNYDSDLSNVLESENYEKYGALYNWRAAISACPDGWHLPSDEDWKILESAVGMETNWLDSIGYRGDNVGSRLATDAESWYSSALVQSSEFATTAFNALPGGGTNSYSAGSNAYWWSSTNFDNGFYFRQLSYYETKVNRDNNTSKYGMSVRCVYGESQPTVALVSTDEEYESTYASIIGGGIVGYDGGLEVTQKGLVYDVLEGATLDSCLGITNEGTGIGEFLSTLEGLLPATGYYIRSYAVNSVGVSYGVDVYAATDYGTPIINTVSIDEVTQTSVTVLSELIHTGGYSMSTTGVLWDTLPNPTVDDYLGKIDVENDIGEFECNIQNLNYNKTYYVRAYAVSGYGTGYGEIIEFTTMQQAQLPIVETGAVSDTTPISVVCSGNLLDDGGELATIKGFVWGLNSNSTLEDSEGYSVSGTGVGEYQDNITGLNHNTIYYVRAYASNTGGVSYGDELSFITDTIDEFETCGDSLFYENEYYQTIQFGDRCWFAENLRYLPNFAEVGADMSETPFYFVYDYYGDNVEEAKNTENFDTYGVLYNYAAASTSCPLGWHLPHWGEWMDLSKEVCISTTCEEDFSVNPTNVPLGVNEGAILAGRNELWEVGVLSENANFGISGFDALPGGRYYNGGFSWLGTNSEYWTTEPCSVTNDVYHYNLDLKHLLSELHFNNYGTDYNAYSVRCIKNVLPTIIGISLTEINNTEFECTSDITSDGEAEVTSRGVVWATSEEPSLESYEGITVDGSGIGEFVSSITGLTTGVVYYLRSYATNSYGTEYSEQISFNTYTLPEVTTSPIGMLNQTVATLGGNVLENGGDEETIRGVVVNILGNPTIEENIFYYSSGISVGEFTIFLQELILNTEYYVRAFATNMKGTSYGEELMFHTLEEPLSCPDSPTLLYEGYEYQTVQIGDQCWMAENLKYLPSVVGNYTLSNEIPYYYIYGYNGTDVEDALQQEYIFSNCYETHGVLYNWSAALDACPQGWHLPSESDWTQLLEFVASNDVYYCGGDANAIAKALSFVSEWNNGDFCAPGGNRYLNNGTGFSVLGSGVIEENGGDDDMRNIGQFWSSTENNIYIANSTYFYRNNSDVQQISTDKKMGLSIRCIKD